MHRTLVASASLALLLPSCGPAAGGACDLSGFLAVQHAHANRAEVTLCGNVVRIRPERRTRSGAHRSFDVDVGHNDVVEIDANVDVMGTFPVRTGDAAVVHGEYYVDPNGREGVHWVHHAVSGRHPAGYVTLNGHRYE